MHAASHQSPALQTQDTAAAAPLTAPGDAFLDWWFNPWDYAVDLVTPPAHMHDALARRDGYRPWCRQAGLAADLPLRCAAGWSALAESDGQALLATAQLFGGLLAARQQQGAALAELAPAQRAWCLRTAALQPLVSYGEAQYLPADTLALRGLSELAHHLEHGFPGLWPRLRLLLPDDARSRIAQLRAALDGAPPPAGALRVQRCWRMCRERVHADAVQR